MMNQDYLNGVWQELEYWLDTRRVQGFPLTNIFSSIFFYLKMVSSQSETLHIDCEIKGLNSDILQKNSEEFMVVRDHFPNLIYAL